MGRKKKISKGQVTSDEGEKDLSLAPHPSPLAPELIIQFIGKKKQLNPVTGKTEIVYREAPRARRNNGRIIELPPGAEQRKGFTHPDAALLLAAYPRDFKVKRPKGEK